MSILAAIQQATAPLTLPVQTPAPLPPMPLLGSHVSSHPSHPTVHPSEAPKRITMWNKRENRKISGNAAPMEKNIDEYLRKHPECEVYNGQRSQLDPAIRAAQLAAEPRITIWNKSERRKVSGNAAPLEKNIEEYLRKHPDCEVYDGQDKRPCFPQHPMSRAIMSAAPVCIPGRKHLATALPPPPAAVQTGAVPVFGSPNCTLDFLAMVAVQENLNLLQEEDYTLDGDASDDEGTVDVKPAAAMLPMPGKRTLECSAIDELVKRVKAA